MPCTDNGYPYAPDTSKLDKATRILCRVLAVLERQGTSDNGYCTQDTWEEVIDDAETSIWWAAHKKVDAERIAREKAKATEDAALRALLDRLTEEELDLIRRKGTRK